MKKDPNAAFNFGVFLWLYDGAFGSASMNDVKPGKNLNGFKGKVVFLWPFSCKGRHDPKGRNTWGTRMAEYFAKPLKAKPIDSYLLTDADVAKHISGCFAAKPKPDRK